MYITLLSVKNIIESGVISVNDKNKQYDNNQNKKDQNKNNSNKNDQNKKENNNKN